MKKLPKKPKRPAISASLKTWENYDKKISEWNKKCSGISGDHKRKANLIKKHTK